VVAEAGADGTAVWDSGNRRFTATGEAAEGEVSALEQIANALSGSAGRFLKGPVPWPWIVAAAALPGSALIVGLSLWRLAGALKSRTITLGNADLKPFGVDRAAKSRALASLEGAGLIKVAREPGRFPSVTLLVSAGSVGPRRLPTAPAGGSIPGRSR
jgi:hypothetical protein